MNETQSSVVSQWALSIQQKVPKFSNRGQMLQKCCWKKFQKIWKLSNFPIVNYFNDNIGNSRLKIKQNGNFQEIFSKIRGCPLFRKLCSSALVLLAVITTVIPDKHDGDMHSTMNKYSLVTSLPINNLLKKAFKNSLKINPSWRVYLFCTGWLRNVHRLLTHENPL